MTETKDTAPLIVSIRCITYNHEPYIKQCLDGFIMQKTNFRFEAIIHDDASTDGTANIIREYAEKYPDIIKPIFETENQFSKHNGSIRRIMEAACKGKYIAMCEGDDYWTDPLKLQKQVDWLETHPDCTLVFSNAYIHFEEGASPRMAKNFDINGIPQDRLLKEDMEDRDYTFEETWNTWFHPTASWVFRREILDSEIYKKFLSFPTSFGGSVKLRNACSFLGKIHSFSTPMCVYRIHQGGITQNIDTDYSTNFIDELFYIKTCKLDRSAWIYLKKKYTPKIMKSIILICIGKGNKKNGWHSLKPVIKYYPRLFLLSIMELPLYFFKKISNHE